MVVLNAVDFRVIIVLLQPLCGWEFLETHWGGVQAALVRVHMCVGGSSFALRPDGGQD